MKKIDLNSKSKQTKIIDNIWLSVYTSLALMHFCLT